MITFFVPGTPKPAGSKRGFLHRATGRVLVVDACAKSKDWKHDVGMIASQHRPNELLAGPLRVIFAFRMLRPKGHYGSGKNAGVVKASAAKYPTTKPDALKLARGVEDAMTGIIYRDDSQIVIELIYKTYVNIEPGVRVTIDAL